ncbi:hypothetical protein ACMX2H_17510 [Arthrobacter sulfonylureivorans]|uniref:hypothetical protein n=1 Tax=Arthrobacter sulfonylureivorans TaxID=2486855 RepID=UPI0039E43ABE
MANIGVEVVTSLRSGPTNQGTPSGALHIAGLTEKGPASGATLVRSMAEFEQVFGGRTAYASNVYDTARLFFEEGGSQLHVSRVVGPAATAGSLALLDSAASPAETILVEAIAPGAYSTSLTVEVVAAEDAFTVVVRSGGSIVHQWRDLQSPAELVEAAAGSKFIKVTDSGSETAAPANNPASRAETPLGAGSDDRVAVTTEHVLAALDAAGTVAAAGGAVALPGYSADLVGTGLLAHAKSRGKLAVLAMHKDATLAEAAEQAERLMLTGNGDAGGIFYPHLVIPDGSGTRTVSPEGYVAAVRARTHTSTGPWQPPAGDRALTQWATGTNVPVDTALNNQLNAAHVNGIVTTGARVRLYNWSSLSVDRDNLAMLTARDTLNNLTLQVKEALEEFTWSTADPRGQLRSKIESAVVGIVDPIAKAGGLYPRVVNGEEADPGYLVSVDDTSAIGANELQVTVAVRLAPTVQLIKAEIIKVALAAAV